MILNVRAYSMLDDTLNVTLSWRDEDQVTGDTGPWVTKNVMIRPGDRDVADSGVMAFLTGRYLVDWARQHGVS